MRADTDDIVMRAKWGDFKGLSLAGLTRMSIEPEIDRAESRRQGKVIYKDAEKSGPLTGRDIRNRDEQEKDDRHFVEAHGGVYARTYEEPDTSGWKKKRYRDHEGKVRYRVPRPVLEGALEDLKRGYDDQGRRIDGLVVPDPDRLARDLGTLEMCIDVVVHHNKPILDITGTLDLLTRSGRQAARHIVTGANGQSEATSRRVERKHHAMQQLGIPAGGRRPFGWNEDRRTLNPTESAAIKEQAKLLKARETTVRQVGIAWNEAGLRTTSGHLWKPESVKTVFRNPRIAGWRARVVQHHNPERGTDNQQYEIVYTDELDENGQTQPVRGLWEAILSDEDWREICEVIGFGAQPGDGHNARKYLGTGTLRCGKCNTLMRVFKAAKSRNKPADYFDYGCPDKGSGRGCGGTRIIGQEADKVIKYLVIAKHQQEAAERAAKPQAAQQQWPGQAELDRVVKSIAELEAQRGKISDARFYKYLAQFEADEKAMRRDRNTWLKRNAPGRRSVDLAKDWDSMPLDRKRGYVELALTAVLVMPAGRGRKVPAKDRMKPVFVDDEE